MVVWTVQETTVTNTLPGWVIARIFLCYRRDDSAGHSGRIFDHLTSRLGAGRVFMDVEGIEAGENFAKVIEASIGSSDTVVVVIGRQWAEINDTGAEVRGLYQMRGRSIVRRQRERSG